MYKNICVNYTGFYTPFIEHNYDKNCLNIFLLTFTFLVLLVIFYRLYVRGDTPGVCIVRGRGGGRGGEVHQQSVWPPLLCRVLEKAEWWRWCHGSPRLADTAGAEYWIFGPSGVVLSYQLTQRGPQCHQHGDHGNSCSYGDTATT